MANARTARPESIAWNQQRQLLQQFLFLVGSRGWLTAFVLAPTTGLSRIVLLKRVLSRAALGVVTVALPWRVDPIPKIVTVPGGRAKDDLVHRIALVAMACAGVAPCVWFRDRLPIKGVDSYFLVHPAGNGLSGFFLWTANESTGLARVDVAAPLTLVQDLLVRILPVWAEQATILCVIALVAVFGAYVSCRALLIKLSPRSSPLSIELGAATAAIFWVVNPFALSFVWWHQLLIQLTWAAVPWYVLVLTRSDDWPIIKCVASGCLLGALGRLTLSEPYIPSLAVLMATVFLINLGMSSERKRYLKHACLVLVALFIGSLTWLLPAAAYLQQTVVAATAGSPSALSVLSITSQFSSVRNVLSLTGFANLHESAFGVSYNPWANLVLKGVGGWLRFAAPFAAAFVASVPGVTGLRGWGRRGAWFCLPLFCAMEGSALVAAGDQSPIAPLIRILVSSSLGSSFRSAIDRASISLIFPMALLLGLCLVWLCQISYGWLVAIAISAVTVGYLAIPWWDGSVVPVGGNGSAVASGHYALPASYEEIGKVLASGPPLGFTMVLPYAANGAAGFNWQTGIQVNQDCLLNDWVPSRGMLCSDTGVASADVVGSDLSAAIGQPIAAAALARIFGVDSWIVHKDWNSVLAPPEEPPFDAEAFLSGESTAAVPKIGRGIDVRYKRLETGSVANYVVDVVSLIAEAAMKVLSIGPWIISVAPEPESPGHGYVSILGPRGVYWPSDVSFSVGQVFVVTPPQAGNGYRFEVNGLSQAITGSRSFERLCGLQDLDAPLQSVLRCPMMRTVKPFGLAIPAASGPDSGPGEIDCPRLRAGLCLYPGRDDMELVADSTDLGLWQQQALPPVYAATASVHTADNSFGQLLTGAIEANKIPRPVIADVPLPSLGAGKVLSTTRLSPTHIEGTLELNGRTAIVFLNSFDRNWVLHLNGFGNSSVGTHFVANGYANGWIVSGTGRFTYSIVFAGQRLFDWSEIADGIGVLASVATLIGVEEARRRRRRNLVSMPDGPRELVAEQ